MHKQAAQRSAALACRAHGRKGDAAQRQVQIGRRGDDGSVVATQLQNGAGKAGCQARAHGAAHGGGAGGRQHGHAGILNQHLANVALANDQLQQARGRVAAKAGQCALGDGVRGQGRQRGFLRRLPHHRVATHHRQRGVPRPHGHGEVEGRDHTAHAQRVPGFHHAVAGALGGNGQAVELARQAHGKVADVDHLLHFAQAFGGNLARFQGHQAAQVGLGGAQFLAQQANQFTPARCGHRAPGSEGCVCAANGVAGLRGRVLGHMGHHFAGEGRAHSQVAPLVSRRGHAQALQQGMDFRNDAGSNRGVRHGNQPVRCSMKKLGQAGQQPRRPGTSISAAKMVPLSTLHRAVHSKKLEQLHTQTE